MHSYSDDSGRYGFEARKNLGQKQHQDRFCKAASEKKWFRCGCCDVELWLIPVTLGGDRFTLRRHRVSDRHLPTCFASTLKPMFGPREVIYTGRMLMEEGDKVGEVPSGDPNRPDPNGGPRYESFVHFFQACVTRASIEAFRAVNTGRSYRDPGLSNPSLAKVFGRLGEIFYEPLLFRRKESLATALQRLGLELLWGLTHQPLVEEEGTPLSENEVFQFGVGAHWECHGYQATRALLEMSQLVLTGAAGKVRANGHVISPPYLYAAITKRENGANRVIRFFRVPVCLHRDEVYIVESAVERRRIVEHLDAGRALLKPHVQADLRGLGSDLWPFPTDQEGRIPSRPDAILFQDGEVKLDHITDTKDPTYHASVDEDIAALKSHFFGYPVKVLKDGEAG